jgi:hypothetical protein
MQFFQNKANSKAKFYNNHDQNNTLKTKSTSTPNTSSMNTTNVQDNAAKVNGLNSNLKTTNRDLFLKSDMWYE